mmetsp:Transcript_11960/g.33672  ORF Transcript_11960/g.33672 Transcript_11960/m.33672 type:complete len:253 (+) Transcript_11960:441-1199(+)
MVQEERSFCPRSQWRQMRSRGGRRCACRRTLPRNHFSNSFFRASSGSSSIPSVGSSAAKLQQEQASSARSSTRFRNRLVAPPWLIIDVLLAKRWLSYRATRSVTAFLAMSTLRSAAPMRAKRRSTPSICSVRWDGLSAAAVSRSDRRFTRRTMRDLGRVGAGFPTASPAAAAPASPLLGSLTPVASVVSIGGTGSVSKYTARSCGATSSMQRAMSSDAASRMSESWQNRSVFLSHLLSGLPSMSMNHTQSGM